MKRIIFLVIFLISTNAGYSQDKTITAKILDQSSNKPIPYVNVGIAQKQTGTVSNSLGIFSLVIPDSLTYESLIVSAIGYETKSISVQELVREKEVNIFLTPKIYNLDRVTVSASKLKNQTVGIRWNGLIKVAGMIEDDNLGYEFALGMKCRRYPCIIKKVDLEIVNNEFNPALFRLNIYESKQEKPSTNILHNPIFVKTDLNEGTLEIPLNEDSIWVNKDFFVSLEWIHDPTADTTRTLSLRGRLLGNKRTWVRKTSQASWRKVNSLNIVMSADVLN